MTFILLNFVGSIWSFPFQYCWLEKSSYIIVCYYRYCKSWDIYPFNRWTPLQQVDTPSTGGHQMLSINSITFRYMISSSRLRSSKLVGLKLSRDFVRRNFCCSQVAKAIFIPTSFSCLQVEIRQKWIKKHLFPKSWCLFPKSWCLFPKSWRVFSESATKKLEIPTQQTNKKNIGRKNTTTNGDPGNLWENLCCVFAP